MKYGSIETGNKLVFQYEFIADDEEQIADDEYTETIQFEIDPELHEFRYSNDELNEIKAILSSYCFCYFPISDKNNVTPIGTIKGKRLSNTSWNIDIDVTFYGDRVRTISDIFRLGQP